MSRLREQLTKEFDKYEKTALAVELSYIKSINASEAADQVGVQRTAFFKLLSDARNAGLQFTLDPEKFLEYPNSSMDLERELIVKLGIQSAIAVEIPKQLSTGSAHYPIYHHLMYQLLAKISSPRIDDTFRSQDHIATGGGVAISEIIKYWDQANSKFVPAREISALYGDTQDINHSPDIIAVQLSQLITRSHPEDDHGLNLWPHDQTDFDVVILGESHPDNLPWKELQKASTRVYMAGGLHKVPQILQTLGSGFITHLVTDGLTAEALLEQ